MQTGDIVYVVGSPKALAAFVKRCNQAPTEENNAILGTLS